MTTKKVFNNFRKHRWLLPFLSLAGFLLWVPSLKAQVLFTEDCFKGGVTVTGAGNVGSGLGIQADVRWEPDFEIRRIYAVTHRFGWIDPHTMFVNGGAVHWDGSSQAGPETPLSNPWSHPFAVHVRDVTETVMIEDSVVTIDFPQQQFYENAWNWGWWSVYLVILYEAPHINQDVCIRLYTADQSQSMQQNYTFDRPAFIGGTPVLLSLFAARINNVETDKSRIWLNSEILGDIMGYDLTNPPTIGTQGHFYYEEYVAQGLNGDTANHRFKDHDAIAIINQRLQTGVEQNLSMVRILPTPGNSGNLHPAFTLLYTPSCPVISTAAMPRSYEMCRGDSVQLSAAEGFDHYAWSPAAGLSDSTAAAPLCSPAGSGWYRLRMWNDDDANGCPQTVPVMVKVNPVPRPERVVTTRSICPENTGILQFINAGGQPPLEYIVGPLSQANPDFTSVPPDTHAISVTDGLGCTWDSTAVIGVRINHTAAFTANPAEGVTPLDVQLTNQSAGADGYIWSVDGAHLSNAANPVYTFADSGAFEVQLIAFRGDPLCADTAVITIFVEPGIELELPNIITPNGDGRNDRFIARVLGARSLRWEVFNRWGHSMHSGQAATSPFVHEEVVLWDPPQTAPSGGNNRASRPEDAVSDGVYMLVLYIEGIAGNTEEVKQAVTVTR